MSPGLNAEHHYIVTVFDRWVVRAKEIWGMEQEAAKKKGMANIFFHEHGWCGKIGEWAVKAVFPDLTPITQHFNPTKYDFKSPKTDLIYEVKTSAPERAFEDSFHFNVNSRQYKENNNDIYVACYYMPHSSFVRVCGWIYKEMVETRGQMTKKGHILGKNNIAQSDFWKVPYRELNAISLFPG